VLDVRLDLLLLPMRHEPADSCADAGSNCSTRDKSRREDQSDDCPADRSPLRALARLVEVVVDMDLAVGAAADEDEPVNLDHVVLRKLLQRVPVFARHVGIRISGDIEIDRGCASGCHASSFLSPAREKRAAKAARSLSLRMIRWAELRP